MTEPDAPESWLNLQVLVPADRVERAEAALFELGAVSVSLLDAADHPLHEPGPGEMPVWPQVVVRALFARDRAPDELSAAVLEAGIVDDSAAIEFANLAGRDWERAWMDRFRPMSFGNGLWICPSHVPPDPDWPLVVRLDPGLAFGSGTHPTTALCLEWIAALSGDLDRVIDFGCGSGVLAIAAALKGARDTIAIDHDPQALTATRDNASRNGVAGRIRTCTPEQFAQSPDNGETAGLVIANILAGPLIELAPTLSRLVAARGELILSGILPEQAEAVAAAYRQFDPRPSITERDGWVRLVLRAGQ